MNFTLNDSAVNFTLSGGLTFVINDQVIVFKLTSAQGVIQNLRLLEDGNYRLLENGDYRLLE